MGGSFLYAVFSYSCNVTMTIKNMTIKDAISCWKEDCVDYSAGAMYLKNVKYIQISELVVNNTSPYKSNFEQAY